MSVNKQQDVMLEETKTTSFNLFVILGSLWIILSLVLVIYLVTVPYSITITWSTDTEVNTAGFNVYRSQTPVGDFIQVNPTLINSRGNAVEGSTYSFTDNTDLQPNITYFYVIEEMELNATTTKYNDSIISSQTDSRTLLIILTIASAFIGPLLLATGVREK